MFFNVIISNSSCITTFLSVHSYSLLTNDSFNSIYVYENLYYKEDNTSVKFKQFLKKVFLELTIVIAAPINYEHQYKTLFKVPKVRSALPLSKVKILDRKKFAVYGPV